MFITFEGMDGSGKTTQLQLITAFLREQGYDILLTREPGGTYIGDEVRSLLLDKGEGEHHTPMHPRTELLLFCASRAQLVAEVIQPHLDKGGVVISDRFFDSTYAYQGYGHGLNLKDLKTIIMFATGGLSPDLTLYLDITPEDGLRRRAEASLFGEEWNRLDDMAMDFHRRVYKGYQKLIAKEPERWYKVDANRSVDAVQQDIRAMLKKRLKPAKKSSGQRKK